MIVIEPITSKQYHFLSLVNSFGTLFVVNI